MSVPRLLPLLLALALAALPARAAPAAPSACTTTAEPESTCFSNVYDGEDQALDDVYVTDLAVGPQPWKRQLSPMHVEADFPSDAVRRGERNRVRAGDQGARLEQGAAARGAAQVGGPLQHTVSHAAVLGIHRKPS